MKLLFLVIITIVFSSNAYAKSEELDREKYDYVCFGENIELDRKGNTGCKNIKKGDVLAGITASRAVLYCDREHPMLQSGGGGSGLRHNCIYNGRPIKKRIELA
jgi:hypothetical protein